MSLASLTHLYTTDQVCPSHLFHPGRGLPSPAIRHSCCRRQSRTIRRAQLTSLPLPSLSESIAESTVVGNQWSTEMAAHSISAVTLSISYQLGTARFPLPALPGSSPPYSKQFYKDSQCRRRGVAASARCLLSAVVSQARGPDRVLPPLDCKDDRLGTNASGAVIIGALVGSLCLSTPALANFQSYDHADMRGANLSGQNLTGAVFAACDCRKIDMSGSNLDGTTDTFAGFQGANLQNTSWIRAFADRVVFREANLQNANFTDAILSGSQFDGADITGADFTDALVDNYQRLRMCKKAIGTNPVTGIATRESLFCQ